MHTAAPVPWNSDESDEVHGGDSDEDMHSGMKRKLTLVRTNGSHQTRSVDDEYSILDVASLVDLRCLLSVYISCMCISSECGRADDGPCGCTGLRGTSHSLRMNLWRNLFKPLLRLLSATQCRKYCAILQRVFQAFIGTTAPILSHSRASGMRRTGGMKHTLLLLRASLRMSFSLRLSCTCRILLNKNQLTVRSRKWISRITVMQSSWTLRLMLRVKLLAIAHGAFAINLKEIAALNPHRTTSKIYIIMVWPSSTKMIPDTIARSLLTCMTLLPQGVQRGLQRCSLLPVPLQDPKPNFASNALHRPSLNLQRCKRRTKSHTCIPDKSHGFKSVTSMRISTWRLPCISKGMREVGMAVNLFCRLPFSYIRHQHANFSRGGLECAVIAIDLVSSAE